MIRTDTSPKSGPSAAAGSADLAPIAQTSSEKEAAVRQIWLERVGAPDQLEIRRAPRREPAPGEVAVATRAVGVNFADVLIRLGVMPDGPTLPAVIGWELAGVVTRGAGELRPGDRVMGVTDYGAYADEVVAPAAQFVELPAGWSFEQGAAFPVSYLLAYEILWVMGSARPGTRVLVHGAAGAVGQAVAQIGRALGCELIGTASPEKHAVLRALGVTPIDRAAFAAEAKKLTGGRGVDLVLDPIGGDHWRESYEALAPGGRLVAYGMHQPITAGGRSRPLLRMVRSFLRVPRFSMLKLLDEGKGVLGVNLNHVFDDPDRMRQRFEQILALPGVSPAVGARFRFEDVREAHAFLQSGKSVGKVVLTVDDAGAPAG